MFDSLSAFYKGQAGRDRIKRGTQTTVKAYDYAKAKRMILEAKPSEAGLYMSGDRGWTYETVWEDGEFVIDLDEEPDIAGIGSSVWATPMLEMDGEDFECYKEEEV